MGKPPRTSSPAPNDEANDGPQVSPFPTTVKLLVLVLLIAPLICYLLSAHHVTLLRALQRLFGSGGTSVRFGERFECRDLDIEFHRPYKCEFEKLNKGEVYRGEWLKSIGKHKIMGIFGFCRHCSRNAEGSVERIESLAKRFKSNSKLSTFLNDLLKNDYQFEKLTKYGIEEAKGIGERFRSDFSVFIQSLTRSEKKVKLNAACTINRTCHTMDLFLKGAKLHNQPNIIVTKSIDMVWLDNSEEYKEGLKVEKIDQIYQDVYGATIHRLISHEFSNSSESLTINEFNLLVQILSLERINKGNKLIENYFNDSTLKKIDWMRENIRLFQSATLNHKAVMHSRQLIEQIFNALHSFRDANASKSSGGELKIDLKFSHDTMFHLLFEMLNWFEEREHPFDGRGIPMCANFQLVMISAPDYGLNNSSSSAIHIAAFQNEKLRILYKDCATPFGTHEFECFKNQVKIAVMKRIR